MSISLARSNCKIWVDGSYYDTNKPKSGSAAVVLSPDDKEQRIAFIQAFNLTRANLRKSTDAELWGATLALEQMKNFNVTELITDCGFVKGKITSIMDDTLDPEQYRDQLYARLRDAIANQDDLHITQVKRSEQKIPIADKFAKAAAKEDFQKIAKHLPKVDAPCLFHHVSKQGRIKNTTLIQHLDQDIANDLDDFDGYKDHEDAPELEPHSTLDPM